MDSTISWLIFPYIFTSSFFFFFINLFIYFWLHWVFVAACRLSLVAVSGATLHCGAQGSHCGGFSCCGAWATGVWASVVVACRLSSCGSQAVLPRGMWDLPGPGLEPVSPVLATAVPHRGWLATSPTTVPPGEPFTSS